MGCNHFHRLAIATLALASVCSACNDNRADCTAWGPSLCGVAGVPTLCPCMCGGGSGPVPSTNTGATPTPTPTPTAGCNDNRADCAAWGPSLCGTPGVPVLCPCMCGGGGSGPVPTPGNSPTPTPTPTPSSTTGLVGYWWQTWGTSVRAPQGTNAGIAFSGYTDPVQALSASSQLTSKLPGTKYISLGGGNAAGTFTAAYLQSITASINANQFSAYGGIVFDVEEGDSGLAPAFASAFAAAKAKGLKVLVTVSHSCPYAVTDGAALMASFFSNPNIDFISPQLYTTGTETSNDYTAVTVPWTQFASSKAAIVPSIVSASMYADAQAKFKQWGVTLQGYIQWQQV